MSGLHKIILENIKPMMEKKTTIMAFHNPGGDKLTDEQFYKVMFKNYRVKNKKPYGLRLTGVGNTLLKRVYDAHTYPITGKVHHQALVLMDLNMQWPYYVGRTLATFYSENDSAWFRLNNNDLKLYTEHL